MTTRAAIFAAFTAVVGCASPYEYEAAEWHASRAKRTMICVQACQQSGATMRCYDDEHGRCECTATEDRR